MGYMDVSVDPEEALFQAHRSRPTRDTLVDLLRFHQDRVYNICFHVLTHPEDAEDASQEVLIEAVRFVDRMKNSHAFKVWLYRVALSTALNLRRSRARRLELARQADTGPSSVGPSHDRIRQKPIIN